MASTSTKVRDVEQEPVADDEFIHHDHIGHGSTPAAWTLVLGVILGSVIIGVGMIIWVEVLIWIGVAILPLAIIAGIVMKKMGYGVELDTKAVLNRGADPRSHQGPAQPDRTRGAEARQPGSGTS
ncbi:HGxxPAAW family protein [Nesterenkonia sp. NBAIMH1]|uniref:HGxxPAAW family protein n=1 Tax=Nesterenkonia sp. NBAIMH1 TaxID=2600320 RepID=UPI001AEFD867|nr:HGxxPAAW family protein [Nesterenkonia sp. NBAIMH1]